MRRREAFSRTSFLHCLRKTARPSRQSSDEPSPMRPRWPAEWPNMREHQGIRCGGRMHLSGTTSATKTSQIGNPGSSLLCHTRRRDGRIGQPGLAGFSRMWFSPRPVCFLPEYRPWSGNSQTLKGPAAFSSSSSLLRMPPCPEVVRIAAPLTSSSSTVVNVMPRPLPQQPKAGPSNLSAWATKPPSSRPDSARARQPVRGAEPAAQPKGMGADIPLRRSSTGASKDDPIVIDEPPSVPTAMKPPSAKRATPSVAASRPPSSSKATPSAPTRSTPTQRVSQPAGAPPPSLTYRTPPSSVPSLPSSASGSASPPAAVPPQPAEPAVKLAGGKRRLGMGRTAVGYTNKKFKPLTPGSS
ncbi:hypothetical protein OH77DRAFT_884669 [Trametes cingulata]|nr:hypothetical protein OH77DRAFT_884669 [Trametes cingulata]